jgi:hypothetical protein
MKAQLTFQFARHINPYVQLEIWMLCYSQSMVMSTYMSQRGNTEIARCDAIYLKTKTKTR